MNHILLIGSGRLANHLQHYFNQLGLPYATWDRAQDPHLLKSKIQNSTHVLLAISDSAIESFFNLHLAGLDKTVVHFSGALHFEDIYCAHPLMTFTQNTYELESYNKIHFVLSSQVTLDSLIPGLKNTYSFLAPELKAKYHALCVSGGNFISILAAEFIDQVEKLNIPPEAAKGYLVTSLNNAIHLGWSGVSGPLVRGDQTTIDKNISALGSDKLATIYTAFATTYQNQWRQK